MSEQNKYMMGEDRIPHAWYNIMADLPSPPPPVLHPGTAALSDGAHRSGSERRTAH
jgi:predicted alternative tryptophan synthase beta-subunit